jgi:hypothetical protein
MDEIVTAWQTEAVQRVGVALMHAASVGEADPEG